MSGPRIEADGAVLMAPRVADPAVLDEVVGRLQEIERGTGLARTLAIGELILNQFFAADPAAWHERRRNKNNSIRRLALREGCPFCKSALNEAVAVYVAIKALPIVRTFGHITSSHIACVLTVAPAERKSILECAERGRWSVRELRSQVVSRRRLGGERRGRPRESDESRALSALRTNLRPLAAAAARVEALSPLTAVSQWQLREMARDVSALGTLLLELGQAAPEVTRSRHSEVRALDRGRSA